MPNDRPSTDRRLVHRLLVGLACLATLLVATATQAQVVSIAVARAQPPGTLVTVQGAVSVPSGRYSSSTFDQGFGLQDFTGGVYVSSAFSSGLGLFHLARVTGVVGDDGFGVLVLRPATPADVVRLPGLFLVLATPVATGAVGEATEGKLVRVKGVVTRPVVNDLPFGYQVFIDDGSGETQVFIPASTGIDPFALPYVQPGRRIHAVGQSAQFQAQFEVLPRFWFDLLPGF